MNSKKISRWEYAFGAFCIAGEIAAIIKLLITGCVYHPKIGTYCGKSAVIPMLALSALTLLYPAYLALRYFQMRSKNEPTKELNQTD